MRETGTRQRVRWVGEATQRCGRADALHRDARNPHAHAQDRQSLDVSSVDGYDFDLFRDVAFPRLQAMAPLRYQLVDIPLKLHHPMWCSTTRHRLRLPRPARAHARAGRTPRTRPADRRDRQHPAGPQPPILGDVRRRGTRRRPRRDHPQGASRARRRRRVGEPVGQGVETRGAGTRRALAGLRRRRSGTPKHRAATQSRGPRPCAADPPPAQAGRRDRRRVFAGAQTRAGAGPTSGSGPQLRAAADVPQPCGAPWTALCNRAAVVAGGQGDRQAVRCDAQRHRVGHRRRRAAHVAAPLRRSGRRAADRRRPDLHRPVAGSA